MAADNKFRKGDRVTMTESNPYYDRWPIKTGVVVGFSRDYQFVRVRPDAVTVGGNLRNPGTYHPDFWDVQREKENKNESDLQGVGC